MEARKELQPGTEAHRRLASARRGNQEGGATGAVWSTTAAHEEMRLETGAARLIAVAREGGAVALGAATLGKEVQQC